MTGDTGNLIRYREFVWNLVLVDLKVRYRKSLLGFLWQVINPFVLLVILAVVFGTIVRFTMENFAAFLICGLVPWSFFSQGVLGGMGSVVSNESLIRRIWVPKVAFPLAAVLSQLMDTLVAMIPLIGILWFMGIGIGPAVLFLPVAMIILFVATIGLALIFCTAYVYLRDVGHFASLLMQAWFYLTPIIYPLDALPEEYQIVFRLNPMAHVIECFRAPLYAGQIPPASTVGLACGFSMVVLGIGLWAFSLNDDRFVFQLS